MSTELLARLQFAFTISFHYLYPPLSIGLGLLLVVIEGLWLKTKNPLYHQMARFWTKVFALTLAIGVATCMVALGAHFSAIWIIVANSWMQTPAGFHIVGEGLHARAEITDFWAMVFNPSSMDRLGHTVVDAWQAGAWLMVSIGAWYLLRKQHRAFVPHAAFFLCQRIVPSVS